MKKLIVLLLLISPVCLRAQNKPSATETFNASVYILDDKQVDKATFELAVKSADDIVEISIVKDAGAAMQSSADAKKGTLIGITKKYAIKSYQAVFSGFSDDLESWLTSHGTDDAQFHYFVDDAEVDNHNTKGVDKLYSLKKDQIDTVTFVQDEPEGSKYVGKIKIVTKK